MTAIISTTVPHRFSEDLNFTQYAAVTHLGGPLLVLAGPGTGKTRVLTYRVAWLLDQGISPAFHLFPPVSVAFKEMPYFNEQRGKWMAQVLSRLAG